MSLDDLSIPPGKLIAHHHIVLSMAVNCSMDIETGGEFYVLIQLSAQIFRLSPTNEAMIEQEEFNKYIKPPRGAIWDQQAVDIHGMNAASPKIVEAERITHVWSNFCQFLERHINPTETCLLIAYNGETCDLQWIWKLSQAPILQSVMPPQICF